MNSRHSWDLDSVFFSMSQGVALHELVYGPNGTASDYRILELNPSFERHTGISAAQIKGRLASEAYGTGSAPYLSHYETAVRTGHPHCFETFFPPLNRHFEVSICPSGPHCFATVFTDITARKSEAIARLAGHVAHAINTPAQYAGDNTRFLQEAFRALCRVFQNHQELLAAADADHLPSGLLSRCRGDMDRSDPDFLLEQVPLAVSQTLEGLEQIASVGRAMKELSQVPSPAHPLAELTRGIIPGLPRSPGLR